VQDGFAGPAALVPAAVVTSASPGPAASDKAKIAADILAKNSHGDCVEGDTGVEDDGYNIDDDGTCALTATGSVSDSASLDGHLGSLGDNGGPTQTVPLTNATGNPAAAVIPGAFQLPDGGQPCTVPDQRLQAREAACDMGAFELSGSGPTISGRVKGHPNSAGWFRRPVTVVFTCTAGSAPLAGSCPKPVTLHHNGRNRHVTRTVKDTDGRPASTTVGGINIDKTDPHVHVHIRVVDHHNGHTTHHLKCVAHDALSGVASCKIHRHHKGVTVHWTAVAKDKAGNKATKHGSYTP
jgi:hypothetical protein